MTGRAFANIRGIDHELWAIDWHRMGTRVWKRGSELELHLHHSISRIFYLHHLIFINKSSLINQMNLNYWWRCTFRHQRWYCSRKLTWSGDRILGMGCWRWAWARRYRRCNIGGGITASTLRRRANLRQSVSKIAGTPPKSFCPKKYIFRAWKLDNSQKALNSIFHLTFRANSPIKCQKLFKDQGKKHALQSFHEKITTDLNSPKASALKELYFGREAQCTSPRALGDARSL